MDFGSGRGELCKTLVENGFNNCSAVDSDETCVNLSKQYCKAYLIANLEEFKAKFKQNSFDIVIALHVLEHLYEPKKYVEELKEVSKKYIILGVPNLATMTKMSFNKIKSVNEGHLYGWDYPTFENFIVNHCKLKKITYIYDLVIAPKISNFLHKIKLRTLVEERILLKLLPYQTNSIIMLCEKTN
jgi:ubiquinone/menaquinone biosynthesis C-methylase UbiE